MLKMLGWTTDEVVIRSLAESLALALAAASISVLAVAVWLGPLEARGIAPVFLPGSDAVAGYAVPWRIAPGPAILGTALALLLVLLGTLPSSWRAAAAEPMDAMR